MNSCLDAQVHAPLIRDMARYAGIARIPVHYISEPTPDDVLTRSERNWFLHIRTHTQHDVYGLLLAHSECDFTRKAFVACGWLLRNYIDGRVYSVDLLCGNLEDAPDPTVMFIPDVHMTTIPEWKMDRLYSLIMDRVQRDRLTVIGLALSDKSVLGPRLSSLFNEYFIAA